MKGRVAALGEIDGRRAAGLLVDGVLQDFLIEPVEDMPTPGAIYRAICDRPLKGQGGMMLRLPEGTAFLRQGKGLRPGQSMLVQVTGYADEGKAIPVTHKPLFKSRFAIVTPDAPGLNISRSIKDEEERARLMGVAHEIMADEKFGLIVRSSAMGADPDEVAEDIDEMFQLALQVMGDAEGSEPELILEGPDPHHMAWREWDKPDLVASDEDAFENHGILDALEDFRSTYVRLSGGASMYVEPTRALIAVDVNTGGDTSPAAGLKANLAVVKELPKQLRIRGLGGQITIDFAPMAKKDRRQLESAMRTAFRNDSIDTAMVDWTPLGHYELQRKRERMPLGVSF